MRLSTSAVSPAPAACRSCWLRISLFEGAGAIDGDAGAEGELLFLLPGAGTAARADFPSGPAGVLPEAPFRLLSGGVREALSSSATMSLYLYLLARLRAVVPSLPRTWTSASCAC